MGAHAMDVSEQSGLDLAFADLDLLLDRSSAKYPGTVDADSVASKPSPPPNVQGGLSHLSFLIRPLIRIRQPPQLRCKF
jgi:hypothetical protein